MVGPRRSARPYERAPELLHPLHESVSALAPEKAAVHERAFPDAVPVSCAVVPETVPDSMSPLSHAMEASQPDWVSVQVVAAQEPVKLHAPPYVVHAPPLPEAAPLLDPPASPDAPPPPAA